MDFSNLWKIAQVQSRSICPENPTGEKAGGARAVPTPDMPSSELGLGWKVRPSIRIAPGEECVLADIKGPGMIKHIWTTCVVECGDIMPYFYGTNFWRDAILRIYWEDLEYPSVECPIGDFFACGWGQYAQINSLPVCVNPGSAFNCYWEMPFLKRCRITLENRWNQDCILYYQIDYELRQLPEELCYFHARFRRVNPTPLNEPYMILDTIQGKGQYVGTYMCWGVNSNGWWGEGEIKFYIDGDQDYPTICGTGTEDYFCGSYNFENCKTGQYQEYSTLYAGLPQVIRPDGVYRSQTRFSMYRWHMNDPIYFDHDLRVNIQVLGWTPGKKFKTLQDDLASVAFWYQTLPSQPHPPLQSREELEIT